MKIEFLDSDKRRARITKGFLKKTVAVVAKVPYSSKRIYPQIGWSYLSTMWVYEGTDINCSDSVAISKYEAKLERMLDRARDKAQRDMEKFDAQVKKWVEKDHLRRLRDGGLPEARVVKS